MTPEFRTLIQSAADIAATCNGAFLGRIACIAIGGYDQVEVTLVQVPGHDTVLFELGRVWHLSIGNPNELEGSFVDGIELVHLGDDVTAWPAAARRIVRTFDGMPELAYFHLAGPVEITAVAAIVNVLCGLPRSG